MSKIPADKSQGTERNLIDRRALIHLRATMFYFERNAVGETPTAILFFEIIRTQNLRPWGLEPGLYIHFPNQVS
jgi:hypothetical protein